MKKSATNPEYVTTIPERQNEFEKLATEWGKEFTRHHAPQPPTSAEMFRFLKDRKTKLPSPLELTTIAASTGPTNNPDEALGNAAWLYLRAVKFCKTFKTATAEQRACLCGQYEVAIESRELASKVPKISTNDSVLSEYEYFLKRVARSGNRTVKEEHLKDFFRGQSPAGADPERFAATMLEECKADKYYWPEIIDGYLDWYKRSKSKSAVESGRKRKRFGRKKKLGSGEKNS